MEGSSTSHVIYLSSLGSTETYPDNAPSAFTNEIIPLHLDPNQSYEVAMLGTFIPKYSYTASQDDPECVINILGRANNRSPVEHIHTFKPSINISSKDPEYVMTLIDEQLCTFLSGLYSPEFMKEYFAVNLGIIGYDRVKRRVYVMKKEILWCNLDLFPYCKLYLSFRPRIAAILGFEAGKSYRDIHGERISHPFI